jgi:hypothetical protein
MVQELDLRSCFGGPAFVFGTIVYFNGLAAKVQALIDTGANGYAFINCCQAEQLRCLFPHVIEDSYPMLLWPPDTRIEKKRT